MVTVTFTLVFRHRELTDPQGPLCADWEGGHLDLRGRLPWEACLHDSCWAIVTGGRT